MIGEYELICTKEDSQNLYGHVSNNSISYLYYHELEKKWLISPQIGDPVAGIGISSLQICPEDIQNESSQWQVFTGEVWSCKANITLYILLILLNIRFSWMIAHLICNVQLFNVLILWIVEIRCKSKPFFNFCIRFHFNLFLGI